MPDKIIEDFSKESSNSRDPKKMKAKVAKLEAKVVDGKATGNNKKEAVYDKKLLRKGLGNVQVAISSTTTNPEEEAPKVKVLLQPSLLPVQNTLMRLSKPEPQL